MEGTVYGQISYEVLGMIEFSDWMYHAAQGLIPGPAQGSQVQACLEAHQRSGITAVTWSLGRSNVEYHSQDPRVTRYGEDSDGTQRPPVCDLFKRTLDQECFLRSALDFGHRQGLTIIGHLCMNRHYSGQQGNLHTSRLARRAELQERDKEGAVDGSRLCFALPEYREERLAIIQETVALGLDGICLDFVRQPPMVRYHPALTEPYRNLSGINPGQINPAEDMEAFLAWCRYRADVLTGFLREVRWTLRELELAQRRNVPLSVRITDDGFTANLIGGIDIENWCREGLVDGVVAHPLQWIDGIWTHDVRPYVDLGRHTGVKVLGGVNTYPVENGWQMNPVRIALRIQEQYAAGVARISLYETNDAILRPELSVLLQALHNNQDLTALLEDRAWLQQWPLEGLSANCGMDGHSCLRSLPLSKL